MWLMGNNEWINYGWGESLTEEWKPYSVLNINYKVTPHTLSAIDAAVETITDIVKNYPAPYILMCSGGVDSQAMIWSWLQSKIPFTIMSVRYVSNGICFNEHDHIQLREFADIHKLDVEWVDFDIIDFLENSLPEYSNNYDCDSPQICTHMKMTEHVEKGTVIFAGNYLGPLGGEINYTLLGLHRYSLSINTNFKKIIPFFFLHDSRLATAFNSYIPSIHIPNYSQIGYKLAGFPVLSQNKKYNGFEQIKAYYEQFKYRVSTKTRLKHADKISKDVFDMLFRYPFWVGGCGKTTILPQFHTKHCIISS
jgi:hypothetical protein